MLGGLWIILAVVNDRCRTTQVNAAFTQTHTALFSLTHRKKKSFPLSWSVSCGLAYCSLCQRGRKRKKKGWMEGAETRADKVRPSDVHWLSYLSLISKHSWQTESAKSHSDKLSVCPSARPSVRLCLWLWWQMVLPTWGPKPDLPQWLIKAY